MSSLGYALKYFFSIYIYQEGDGENGVSTKYSKTKAEIIDERYGGNEAIRGRGYSTMMRKRGWKRDFVLWFKKKCKSYYE